MIGSPISWEPHHVLFRKIDLAARKDRAISAFTIARGTEGRPSDVCDPATANIDPMQCRNFARQHIVRTHESEVRVSSYAPVEEH